MEQIKALNNQKSMPLNKIPSTIGLNLVRLDRSQGEFTFWDVGGQAVLRKIWDKYFSESHGLVFVVDGADEMRFAEAKETIDQVFHDDDDESAVHQLPVLFLLNKTDKGEFKGVDLISDRLQLGQVKCRESVIMPVSAIDAAGLEAAVNWIMNAVVDSRR